MITAAADNYRLRAETLLYMEEYTELYLEEYAVVASIRCMIENGTLHSGTYSSGAYAYALSVEETVLYANVISAPYDSFVFTYDPETGVLLDDQVSRSGSSAD